MFGELSMTDQIIKCLLTLEQMMFDRKYPSWSEQIKNIDKAEVKKTAMLKNVFHFDMKEESESHGNIHHQHKLRILFAMQPKFKLSDIKKMIEEDFELTIIVLRDKVSTTNLKSIEEMKKNVGDIQVFHLKELQFNITHHYLVPHHELLGWEKENEISEIITDYQVKNKNQFPIILKTDPVAKYYNAKSGNLFRIYRLSPTAGQYVFYRSCM